MNQSLWSDSMLDSNLITENCCLLELLHHSHYSQSVFLFISVCRCFANGRIFAVTFFFCTFPQLRDNTLDSFCFTLSLKDKIPSQSTGHWNVHVCNKTHPNSTNVVFLCLLGAQAPCIKTVCDKKLNWKGRNYMKTSQEDKIAWSHKEMKCDVMNECVSHYLSFPVGNTIPTTTKVALQRRLI